MLKRITNSILSPTVKSIFDSMAGVTGGFPPGLTWILNFDGTIYAELSEPKTLTGNGYIEFVYQSSGDINGYICANKDVTTNYILMFTNENRIRLLSDNGANDILHSSVPNWNDGNYHTVRYQLVDGRTHSYFDGELINNINADQLSGIRWDYIARPSTASSFLHNGSLKSISIIDEVNPSNSISWTLDSGPPSEPGALPDGTLYEASEEYGTEADVVVNGGFDADSDWTKDSTWIISGGVASGDGSNGSTINALTQDAGIIEGQLYYYSYDLISLESGACVISVGGNYPTYPTAAGHQYGVILGGPSTNIFLIALGSTIASVDNIQVYPVPQGLIYENVEAADWEEV